MEKEKSCKPCRIKAFLEREHTPAEKGVMAAAALLTGVAVGLLLAPATGGIHLELSIGSHNGCYNKDCGSKNSKSSAKEKRTR